MRGFFILILICMLLALDSAEASIRIMPQAKNSLKTEKKLFPNLKNKNHKKTLKITEELLQKNTEDKKLLTKALEDSMATQNWCKALIYTEKLLTSEPDSEYLLKTKGDLYAITENLPRAVDTYQTLIEKYPFPQYYLTLANLYMSNKEFDKAESLLEPLYNGNSTDTAIVKVYLNSLLSQRKTNKAYWIIKTNHLECSPEWYIAMGDMAILDEDYKTAEQSYLNGLKLDPESLILKDRLTQSASTLKNISTQNPLDEDIESNLNLLETELGLEGLNMAKDRVVFYDLLNINPNYVPTKAGLTRSYIGTSHDLSNLEKLKKMPQNDKTKLLKAQAYYDMNMWSNAKDALNGVTTKEAKALKYKIKRDEAITLTPTYSFFFQQLADTFDLDIHQFGTRLSKNIDENKNIFVDYNVLTYTSGHLGNTTNRLNNVVNEFKGGIRSRANEKLEYRADIGVKAFEFGNGAMLVTDSWVKHYFSDKLNMKLGFRRDNVEQSYLSAVGRNVNGIFTGRAADNKIFLEFNSLLPRGLYAFGFGSCGVIDAQNLPTNQYAEGLVGVGKILYNNPKNNWINTFGVDLVSYNASYQFNLLKVPNVTGQFFGGYFSPSYFNATTLNARAEGCIKKCHLRYGLDGFGGIQTAMSPDLTVPAWGVAPYLSFDINDNVSINLSYDHYVYADIQRDQFIINAVIRGFKKHAKN